jgi:inner membrane protein
MNALEQFFGLQAGWLWLILAALLAIAEIAIAPGVFFIFIAIAAAITGAVTLFTGAGPTFQLALFGIFSLISVYTGRYFYARQNHVSTSPNLNDRSAQMVGQTVTVIEATSNSAGRVRVGDSEWNARGPGLTTGTKARIVSVVDGCVNIEPLG